MREKSVNSALMRVPYLTTDPDGVMPLRRLVALDPFKLSLDQLFGLWLKGFDVSAELERRLL